MPRSISEERRESVRAMRARFPRMTAKEIADRTGVHQSSVWLILNSKSSRQSLPKPTTAPKAPMSVPACTVQQPGSIIRPIPLSRLTARR
jgi:hypothetical protein